MTISIRTQLRSNSHDDLYDQLCNCSPIAIKLYNELYNELEHIPYNPFADPLYEPRYNPPYNQLYRKIRSLFT
jgi:hypothetical protein